MHKIPASTSPACPACKPSKTLGILLFMDIESLTRAAEALEQAGKTMQGRMSNPDHTASAVNEAGRLIASAGAQLRGAAAELADVLAERKAADLSGKGKPIFDPKKEF
jgi:flagellar biosynthesis/type III secretory pathway ATPase